MPTACPRRAHEAAYPAAVVVSADGRALFPAQPAPPPGDGDDNPPAAGWGWPAGRRHGDCRWSHRLARSAGKPRRPAERHRQGQSPGLAGAGRLPHPPGQGAGMAALAECRRHLRRRLVQRQSRCGRLSLYGRFTAEGRLCTQHGLCPWHHSNPKPCGFRPFLVRPCLCHLVRTGRRLARSDHAPGLPLRGPR